MQTWGRRGGCPRPRQAVTAAEDMSTYPQGPQPLWTRDVEGRGSAEAPRDAPVKSCQCSVVTDPEVECGGGRTRASVQLGWALPSPTPHTGQRRSRAPGRRFRLQPPSYLLSHEESTLDEPVQHLLTVAVGRLAGLRGDRHPRDLRQARPGLPPQGSGRQGPPPARQGGAGLSGLRRPDLQQQQVLWQQVQQQQDLAVQLLLAQQLDALQLPGALGRHLACQQPSHSTGWGRRRRT